MCVHVLSLVCAQCTARQLELQATMRLTTEFNRCFFEQLFMSGLQDTWITTDEQYGDILWFQLCVFGCLNLGHRGPPLGGVVLLPPWISAGVVRTLELRLGLHRHMDGGLSLKGLGRAFIPEVIADQQGESSAGQEPADTPPPPPEPEIQTEFTAL